MEEVLLDSKTDRTFKAVYTIVERQEKKFWVRIGRAFVNHDKSLNVYLDAAPTNGQLHIRDYVPKGEWVGSNHKQAASYGGVE